MRHQKSGRKFSRTSAHRQSMFENMAASLIKHELIRTTLPKAKELRRVAEPLITMSKTDGVANRRLAFARLRDKQSRHPIVPGLDKVAQVAVKFRNFLVLSNGADNDPEFFRLDRLYKAKEPFALFAAGYFFRHAHRVRKWNEYQVPPRQ